MYIMPFIPQYISFIEGSNYAVKWNQKLKVMEKKKAHDRSHKQSQKTKMI